MLGRIGIEPPPPMAALACSSSRSPVRKRSAYTLRPPGRQQRQKKGPNSQAPFCLCCFFGRPVGSKLLAPRRAPLGALSMNRADQLFSDSDAVRQSAHFLTAGQNGNKIQALELTGEDPSVRVSRTRESACSQRGKVTPNVCSRRWHDKRELAGRLAGRGNSLVLMGTMWGTVKPKVPDDLVNRAFANPNQVVSPVLVRL